MTSTDTTGTHNAAGATDGLLAPIAAAFAVGSRPGVLGLGLAAGAAVGALGGSAASLAYIRSPAAVPYVVVAAGLIVVMWSIAAGAVAVAAGERGASVAAGLRRALRRTVPLVVAAVPAALIVGVLLVAQVGVFALTQMGARGPLGELPARPLALIALVYTLIFFMNVVVIVPAGAALWLVLPHVMRGAGPIEAHARVRGRVLGASPHGAAHVARRHHHGQRRRRRPDGNRGAGSAGRDVRPDAWSGRDLSAAILPNRWCPICS